MKRGLAAHDAERRKEIATRGGRASAAKGAGHRFDSAEGKLAMEKWKMIREGKATNSEKSTSYKGYSGRKRDKFIKKSDPKEGQWVNLNWNKE